LNAITGLNFNLPTEAEWEYAARGGTAGSKTLTYSGSNIIDEVAWYNGNSGTDGGNESDGGGVHIVGTKTGGSYSGANALGLYDMSGNVYEWCIDWSGLSTFPVGDDNPVNNGPSGNYRVLRGGGWRYSDGVCKVIYISRETSNHHELTYGFRLVLIAPAP
jgi:formylglycine-generating enzyme required for sulfatase activity